MELLALIGITWLIRLLRRRPRQQSPAAAASTLATTTTRGLAIWRPSFKLLTRAARGLLLAGLLLVLALLPFPHNLTMSMYLAPAVEVARWQVIANLDVLLVIVVGIALLEPLLARTFRALCLLPRLVRLLVRLGWVRLRIVYWRYRNWCVRRGWQPSSSAM